MMLDLLMGMVGRLIVVAVVAVFVAQQIALILTVLLAAFFTLAVVRLFWPRPR